MNGGLLIVHKPIGFTSHYVVERVRQLCHVTKAGHAGTLDPAAEGVLPIAIGTGTKFLEFLRRSDKAYLARVTFGVETDTYDADGRLIGAAVQPDFALEHLLAALDTMKGRIEQIPPPYSAVKAGGVSLHRLVRRGERVQPAPRTVEIRQVTALKWDKPHLYLWIECTSGTYVRALAHDLGRKMGTSAYLSYLLRARHGPFYLDEAVSLEQVERASEEGWIESLLLPPEEVLSTQKIAVVNEAEAQILQRGSPLAFSVQGSSSELVALTPQGNAAAIIARQQDDLWYPRKVFPIPA